MATSNRGIVKLGQGKAVLTSVPVPKLRDDCLLLRTIAVALNPTDWQTVDEAFSPGTTRSLIGCDCAGIVVEVGSKLTGSFKKGDRVAAFAHGGSSPTPEDAWVYTDIAQEMIMMKRMELLQSTLLSKEHSVFQII